MRPAINAGLSVSRVGGAAQTKIMKKLAGGVRIALAQYRELEAFSQFASDLDEATRKQLERGQRAMAILKQPPFLALSVAEISFSWFLVEFGYLDDVALEKVNDFEKAFRSYLLDTHHDLLDKINAKPVFDDETKTAMVNVVKTFKETQTW